MKKFGLPLFLLFLAHNANAGHNLNFEQLRESCKNPSKYHSQVQPTGIKIDCADRQLTWVPADDDKLTLPTSRQLAHSVTCDKFAVPLNKAKLDIPVVQITCPVYKQIEETVQLSHNLTCDQLINFNGGPTDMCKKLIDQTRMDNAQAIVKKETGKVTHLCMNGDRSQRGQKDVKGEEAGQRGQKEVKDEGQREVRFTLAGPEPEKEVTPNKEATPSKEATPNKEAVPNKEATPSKEATPNKEAAPNKEVDRSQRGQRGQRGQRASERGQAGQRQVSRGQGAGQQGQQQGQQESQQGQQGGSTN